MGSTSSSVHWIILAAVSGLLYLLFDAARHFAQQIGPVRLRGLAAGSDDDDEEQGWAFYEADKFQLVSGSLLQLALIGGVAGTVMIFSDRPLGRATLLAILIWIAIIVVWKFILALVPEDVGEVALKSGLIPISHFFYYLFFPVLYPLRKLNERRERIEEEEEEEEEVTDEEVQAYIDVGQEEGILEPAEGKMLQQIVDFGDRMARELMTPRIDVQAFDANLPIDELARLFSESKYSRIPIYTENIDRITGIVHIKEIFDAVLKNDKRSVSELARPPYFVSETKLVSELLREFQSEHIQVAVVVDEYGGTAGLISIEDIIEEIVGEIADEHEEEEATIVDLGDDQWLVSGLLRVEQLEETLGADLVGEDYETVAGLIFTTLGRVPNVGTMMAKNGFRFIVDRADRRRIYRVKVTRDPEWRPEGEEEEDE